MGSTELNFGGIAHVKVESIAHQKIGAPGGGGICLTCSVLTSTS